MRKHVFGVLFVVLCLWGTFGAAANLVSAQKPRTMDEVVDRVIASENKMYGSMKNYSPLVETYIQNLKPDKTLGQIPAGDKYFLGRADFSKGVNLVSLSDTNDNKGKKMFTSIGNFFSFSMQFLPDGFLQMIFMDTDGFDKQHYKFDYVKREFLGEVRCLVFDVTPLPKSGKGRFLGRIWVEDQDFNVVRFNGGYEGGGHSSWYFHFDSWRTNVQPGIWVPTFLYSEERDLHYAMTRKLDFKAQTRLWGYNIGHAAEEQELSKILVESPVNDQTTTANDLTPIQAQRSWDRQAEDNVTDRLQRIGLIAPKGDVDKILETVVNNLEVTNNLDVEPDVRCRVMTTSTLESFTIGHTIVLSRGLVDVLPDEPSLASVLAIELAHIVLGHRMDSNYAFFDQLWWMTRIHSAILDLREHQKRKKRRTRKQRNFLRILLTRRNWGPPHCSCKRSTRARRKFQTSSVAASAIASPKCRVSCPRRRSAPTQPSPMLNKLPRCLSAAASRWILGTTSSKC
jgi:hypothetical protein